MSATQPVKTPGRRFLRNSGLSLALLACFLATYLGGPLLTGWQVYNGDRVEHSESRLTLG